MCSILLSISSFCTHHSGLWPFLVLCAASLCCLHPLDDSAINIISLFDVTAINRMSLLPLASRIGAGSERLAPSASPSARTTTSASRRRCCRSESSISSGCSSSLLLLQEGLLHLVIGDPRRVHHEERRFEACKLVRERPEECHGC